MITLESGGMSYSKKIAYSISKIPIPRNDRKQTGPKRFYSLYLLPLQQRSQNHVFYTQIPISKIFFLLFVHMYLSYSQIYCTYFSSAKLVI
jgi:hypothetical protein